VFIFPSISETFGNVVLEAMSSGLLPVAYDYAAARQVIRSGENGWLAAFDDEAAFLGALRQSAASWSDSAMRAAACDSVSEFGWRRVIEQFEGELFAVQTNKPTLSQS
jgi:glycosyltransferase involved in cell wall biosynthesis